jgi:hypothetical protein
LLLVSDITRGKNPTSGIPRTDLGNLHSTCRIFILRTVIAYDADWPIHPSPFDSEFSQHKRSGYICRSRGVVISIVRQYCSHSTFAESWMVPNKYRVYLSLLREAETLFRCHFHYRFKSNLDPDFGRMPRKLPLPFRQGSCPGEAHSADGQIRIPCGL